MAGKGKGKIILFSSIAVVLAVVLTVTLLVLLLPRSPRDGVFMLTQASANELGDAMVAEMREEMVEDGVTLANLNDIAWIRTNLDGFYVMTQELRDGEDFEGTPAAFASATALWNVWRDDFAKMMKEGFVIVAQGDRLYVMMDFMFGLEGFDNGFYLDGPGEEGNFYFEMMRGMSMYTNFTRSGRNLTLTESGTMQAIFGEYEEEEEDEDLFGSVRVGSRGNRITIEFPEDYGFGDDIALVFERDSSIGISRRATPGATVANNVVTVTGIPAATTGDNPVTPTAIIFVSLVTGTGADQEVVLLGTETVAAAGNTFDLDELNVSTGDVLRIQIITLGHVNVNNYDAITSIVTGSELRTITHTVTA